MPEQQTDVSRPRAVRRKGSARGAVAVLAAGLGCGEETTAPPPPAPPPVPRPTTVTVNPSTVELTALDATVQLTAEVRDQNGQAMAGATLTWASSSSSVATVDASGLVTAAGNGAATVTAAAGSASGESAVTVMQAADSVTMTPSSDMIALGDTLRLVAEAFDENGHRVDGATFAWSSNNASVARVDATGLVTGVGEGRAAIMAEAGDAHGTSEIAVESPDGAALAALYEATDGPNWVNSDNWLTDRPLNEWYGVETEHGRVVSLETAGERIVRPHFLRSRRPGRLGAARPVGQSARGTDSSRDRQLVEPQSTAAGREQLGGRDTPRTRQPLEALGLESGREPDDGADSSRVGRSVRPRVAVARRQFSERRDPASTRESVQPRVTPAQRQRPDWAHPVGTRQPVPASAFVPLAKRPDRAGPARARQPVPACVD